MRTLAIDVGASGIKLGVRDRGGRPVDGAEEHRILTPKDAPVEELVEHLGQAAAAFVALRWQRCGVGFPGVVVDGFALNAPNLGPAWGASAVDLGGLLAQRLKVPIAIANDADVACLGVVATHPQAAAGTTVVMTLGTGFGIGVCVDGRLVPNVELGQELFDQRRTFDQALGLAGLDGGSLEQWQHSVHVAVERVRRLLHPRNLYIGGGNTRLLEASSLAGDLSLVPNSVALAGCVALFDGDSE